MTMMPEPLVPPELLLTSARRPSRAAGADQGVIAVAPGVRVRVSPDLPVWRQRQVIDVARCQAVLHSAPSATALTHLSAALMHGLWLPAGVRSVHVSTTSRARGGRRTLPAIEVRRGAVPRRATGTAGTPVVRHHIALEPGDIELVGGLPATTLLRTAVDCAFDLPARASIVILDSAMRALCRPDRFRPQEAATRWATTRRALLDAVAARSSRRGAVRARAVTQMCSPFSESPGESVLRRLVVGVGLPSPEVQWEVLVGGAVRYLDLAWPDLRVDIEFDGRGKYERVNDLWDEKKRQDGLHEDGWKVLRVTSDDLRDEGDLRRAVLAAFPLDLQRSARPVRGLWE